MKAHEIGNNARLETTELELNGKKYNVAFDLYVLSKVQALPDELDELVSIAKTVKYLCNGAIKRRNKEECTKEPLLDDDDVLLYVGKSNMDYFVDVIVECRGDAEPVEPPETDEDGNVTVITDEMREEFGDAPSEKNAETE